MRKGTTYLALAFLILAILPSITSEKQFLKEESLAQVKATEDATDNCSPEC